MAMRKISYGAAIATAITGVFLTLLTTGLLMSYQTMPSKGTITTVNIGCYLDRDCTQNATSIDWGFLIPGDNATKILYIKNTGTVPVTLTMTTNSWQPTNASALIALSWNLENASLNATQSTEAVLTLAVSPDAGNLGDFSFNIIITGTELAT